MNKIIGFIVGAGIIVALGVWFIAENPGWFESVINWALSSMGIK